MRVVLGVFSLLIVLAVIGVLARKQVGVSSSAGIASEAPPGAALPVTTPQQQSQQLQNQVKKSVEEAMQQARPEPDDK